MKRTRLTKETDQTVVMSSAEQEHEERVLSIEEINRQILENRRIISEESKAAQLRWQELEKLRRETYQQMQETDCRIKETDRQMQETDRRLQETDRIMRETYKQMRETDKKIKELSTRFGSTTGHIIEGLMAPAAFEMLKEAGFKVNRCYKNLKRKSKNPDMAMEIDELLLDDTIAIAVEVKASCDSKDIDNFLKRMERFKALYPENKDKDVYVAIAAVNYERDADTYAHKCGLLVIRATEDLFTLDSHEGDELRVF